MRKKVTALALLSVVPLAGCTPSPDEYDFYCSLGGGKEIADCLSEMAFHYGIPAQTPTTYLYDAPAKNIPVVGEYACTLGDKQVWWVPITEEEKDPEIKTRINFSAMEEKQWWDSFTNYLGLFSRGSAGGFLSNLEGAHVSVYMGNHGHVWSSDSELTQEEFADALGKWMEDLGYEPKEGEPEPNVIHRVAGGDADLSKVYITSGNAYQQVTLGKDGTITLGNNFFKLPEDAQHITCE